ncbi:MAG: hypothetical protein IPK85_02115 [Gemmatimonadetes bacterium]|nr:hypothetical protein [Gemmatimonadota bacterium]
MLGLSALPDFTWGSGDDELMGGAYSDPLSIRLNNPGAIRQSSVQWAGMAPEQDGPFVRFATPEAGIMAMSKNLDSYARRHGLTSIEGIVNRWAPPSENNTNGYVKRVADAMGVDPTQPLNLSDPAVKSALMEAMATVEAGKKHYTRDQIASVITGQPGGAQPMQQPYDEDQGLANIAAMGERVAGMQPTAGISALGARPQPQGLSALSPYLQIASQLMPERQGRPWADALINAGAAMMQSNRPDFLGGLGAGLQAGNATLTQGQNLARQDTLDRFKLGMQLAQFDQKDGGEYAMSDGVLYNKKTGAMQNVGGDKPLSDAGKLQSDLRAGRITPEQYEAAMAKIRGEGESPVMRAMREAGIDPSSPEGQKLIRDYAARVGGGATVNIDNKAETEFARKVAGAQAEAYTNVQKGAAEAISSNARLDRMSQLLEGVQTGKYSTSLMELQKGLSTILGKNAPTIFGKPAEVAQAEAASALANEIALTLRNPAGGAGMPGAMSDADRQFLQSMVPGLETTPEGRKLMVETAKSLNKRAVEVARLMEEYRKSNNNSLNGWELYLADWSEKNPLFAGVQAPEIPAAVPPRAAPNPTGAAGPPAEPPPPPAPTETLRVETPTPDGTGTRVQTVPVGRGDGSIPTFTDPNDPALLALPKGSVFSLRMGRAARG